MLDESVWKRAWRDTETFRQTPWFFWGFEVVGMAMFGGIGLWLPPNQADGPVSILYPIIGVVSGAGVVFLLIFGWNLFRAPYRQRDEARRQRDEARKEVNRLLQERTEQQNGKCPLIVTDCEIYPVGDSSHWLRLRVQNPNTTPIRGCYGKLLERRHIAGGLTSVNGSLVRPGLSPGYGSLSSEHRQLPPEGHRFPWSPTDRQLTITSISGDDGFEYLYLVTKRENQGCFWFPTSASNKLAVWSVGDFELKLEIGSDSENSRPTKAQVVFRAEGGDLELVGWNVLD